MSGNVIEPSAELQEIRRKGLTHIYVLATVHPVGTDNIYDTNRNLRAVDIKAITENGPLVVPFRLDHPQRQGLEAYDVNGKAADLDFGFTVESFVDQKGRLVVAGYIDISHPVAYQIWRWYRLGVPVRLSVWVESNVIKGSEIPVGTKWITEISFTNDPVLKETGIIFMAGMPLSLRTRDRFAIIQYYMQKYYGMSFFFFNTKSNLFSHIHLSILTFIHPHFLATNRSLGNIRLALFLWEKCPLAKLFSCLNFVSTQFIPVRGVFLDHSEGQNSTGKFLFSFLRAGISFLRFLVGRENLTLTHRVFDCFVG